MASQKFKIPFSSIGFAPLWQFIRLIIRYPVGARYYWRCLISGIFSLISMPFYVFEKLIYSKKLSRTPLPASPVFILGHWRSGTTLLHNLICKDDQFAYVTTFQSVFANVFFTGRWFFKPVMKWLMPETRPADNVRLSPDFPQEEGIVLCARNSFSFYNFFYFPRQWKKFYQQYVTGETASAIQLKSYEAEYKKLIAQSLLEHKRREFVSKNPPNTGRIKYLLEMFPEAKFIYIYRNPLIVFQSTVNFFFVTLDALQLQDFSRLDVEEMVFDMYMKFVRDYEEQKSLIPSDHLIEIRYEDFEQSPLEHLEAIYSKLHLGNFKLALPAFKSYLESQKKFEKATHSFTKEEREKIMNRWRYAMELYGYAAEMVQ